MEKKDFKPSEINWHDYYEQKLFGNGWTPEQEDWEPMNGKEFTEEEIEDLKFNKIEAELEEDKKFQMLEECVDFNGRKYMFPKGFINRLIVVDTEFIVQEDFWDTLIVTDCTPLQYILYREHYEYMSKKERMELFRTIKWDLRLDNNELVEIMNAADEFAGKKEKTYKIVISTDPYHARREAGDWKIIDRFNAERVYDNGLSLERAQKMLRLLYIDKACDAFEQEVYDDLFNDDGTGGFEYDVYHYSIEEEGYEDEYEDLFFD